MPSPNKADPAHPAHGLNSDRSSPSKAEIFQKFSRQLDLLHPSNTNAAVQSDLTGTDMKAGQAANASAPHDWEHEDTVQLMVNSLLSGTFDEDLTLHAENLAERLVERQRELDRRESQLNLRSAELENSLRQSRLDSEPMQAASEIEKTIERELANQDNVVTHRLDKFNESQRAPYSLLNKRWKKYIADPQSEHSLKIHQQEPNQQAAASQQVVLNEKRQVALNELTRRATAIRVRGEEVEKMYEQLHSMFSEMLRQHTSLRQVIKTMQADGKKVNRSELEAVKTSLDRLTVRLSRVGKEHFLLPEHPADAA